MMPKLKTMVASVMMIVAGAVTHLATVTWTLQDVEAGSGGALTGSFDYDEETTTYFAINISLGDRLFENIEIDGASNGDSLIFTSGLNPGDIIVNQITFAFGDTLTDAGGDIALVLGSANDV